jgi:hypothetical protein
MSDTIYTRAKGQGRATPLVIIIIPHVRSESFIAAQLIARRAQCRRRETRASRSGFRAE